MENHRIKLLLQRCRTGDTTYADRFTPNLVGPSGLNYFLFFGEQKACVMDSLFLITPQYPGGSIDNRENRLAL